MQKKEKEKNLTITEEEIKNNHIVKSTKSYLIVFSTMFLAIFLLLIGSLFRTNVTPDYPIVFKGANNRLMVITRNNDVNDITNIDETDIEETDRCLPAGGADAAGLRRLRLGKGGGADGAGGKDPHRYPG